MEHFIHCWISVHGPPCRLFSDNGGEFNNDEMKDMAEKFNIEVKTTAAYSPWSNGLLERHNQTLTEILLKVKRDNNCDWKTALDWALMAKNSLHNVHGYSPYQLVFGQNPNLPSVLTDKPPAMETSKSTWITKQITTLHAMRKAFTEAECSERIRRALRKQLRPVHDKYETGDKVYYKRVDCNEWKGPGVVIGQDGVVVFVRHGGTYVRVHQSRLRKVDDPQTKLEKREREQMKTYENPTVTPAADLSDTESENDEVTPVNDGPTNAEDDSEPPTSVLPGGDDLDQSQTTQTHSSMSCEGLRLKIGQTVKYIDNQSGQTHTGKILS